MSPLDFMKFLSSITYRYITNENEYKKLSSAKLHVSMWPECEAKTAIQLFNSLVEQKGFKYALYTMPSKYDAKNLYADYNENTTRDLKEIEFVISTNAKKIFVRKLGHELSLNPDDFDSIFSQLRQVTELSNEPDEYSVSKFLDKAIEKNEANIKAGKSMVLIPDFKILSEQIGGFNPARVTGLSAKSGFGKTKLAINLADSARKIMPVYYFNMEMSAEDFESQFIQKAGGITYKQYVQGEYKDSFQKIIEYKGSFENTNEIKFTGGRSLSIDDICTRIVVSAQGGLVIVDYDQKIVSKERGDEWALMVRAVERLEDAAKQSKAHVIILFQADDEGFAKSSKRAIQPLSSFTHFTKSDDESLFILKNIKNRFGQTGFQISVDYWPETSLIRENNLIPIIKTKVVF